MKLIITIILLCTLICFGETAFAYVVDHNCTDITRIPESAINTAKTNLHIAYGHTSHGSQLISGMGTNQASNNQLDNFLSNSTVYQTTPGLFIWHDGPMAGALDLDDRAMGGDVGYYPQWVNNTESYLGNPDIDTGRGTSHPDVNVIIWSWCGQAAGRTEQGMIDTYLAPMTQLETKYSGITFVYMTGHLNGTGETGNLHLRNEQIRAYCHANNKILYDFADIESYDPDGLVNYMLLNANDSCDYNPNKNWALDWQDAHTEDVDWWASGAAHSQHLNGNLKGYAAWWLWARIAGWDGGSNSIFKEKF